MCDTAQHLFDNLTDTSIAPGQLGLGYFPINIDTSDLSVQFLCFQLFAGQPHVRHNHAHGRFSDHLRVPLLAF